MTSRLTWSTFIAQNTHTGKQFWFTHWSWCIFFVWSYKGWICEAALSWRNYRWPVLWWGENKSCSSSGGIWIRYDFFIKLVNGSFALFSSHSEAESCSSAHLASVFHARFPSHVGFLSDFSGEKLRDSIGDGNSWNDFSRSAWSERKYQILTH